jgi:hypothetical protein
VARGVGGFGGGDGCGGGCGGGFGGGGFLRAWRRGAEAPGPPFSLVEFLVEFMEDFCRGRISK